MSDAENVEGALIDKQEPEAAGKLRSRLLRIAGLVVAIGITVTVYLLRDRLQDVAGYGYLGLFLISILGNATIILPMPTMLTAFLGGSLYNPILVGVISAGGATIGELTGYLAGFGGQAIVENRGMYERFQGWMERYGLVALFVLAAIPNPFFDVAGIIAGMSRIRVTTFMAVTWAGKIVKFVAIAYLGAGSLELIERLFGPQ
jgi:uncharacterized membrane protein YdjX (TVP38/TMEM64 family)